VIKKLWEVEIDLKTINSTVSISRYMHRHTEWRLWINLVCKYWHE